MEYVTLGLHKLDRAILRYIPDLAPFGYLIGSPFAFVTTVSMLILMVEQAGKERDISTERFSTLFKNSKDIIFFYNLDGRIIDANRTAIEKYGYAKEELLGISLFQLRSDDKKVIEQQMAEAIKKGIAFETLHYRKDGTPIPVEVYSVGAIIGNEQVLMSTIRDITERKQAEVALKMMSFTDSLTGLYNRRYLDAHLKNIYKRHNLPISIVIGDMNGIKFINDAFGHKTGDDLLKEMAQLFHESCTDDDLIIRRGGDEFLVILPHTGAKLAENFCHRVKKACQESSFVPIQPKIALGYTVKEISNQNL